MKVRKLTLLPMLFVIPLLLQGCQMELMSPQGPVGKDIRTTLLITLGAMLIVVIPTLWMIVHYALKYRHSNQAVEQEYAPDWDHSTKIEAWAWGVPIFIIIILASITYYAAHKFDPRNRLSNAQPMVIDVVAMNWKWLFIYPDEKIATINELAFPVNQPVEFHITSDSTMNSFFIPRLGSQIYAMAGMENRLNLEATSVGVYKGMSANYSGFGFAGMHFKAHVLSREDYQKWLETVRAEGTPLTWDVFKTLKKDSFSNPITYYSNADQSLYGQIIHQYTGVTTNE